MNTICFMNDGHNGDIIHSKSFVKDIAEQLNLKCLYHYKKSPKLIQDSGVVYTQMCPTKHPENHEKFIQHNNILFISTWLYPYIMDPKFRQKYNIDGINIKTNYIIYQEICEIINLIFKQDIKLKQIEYYLPFIDFNLLDTKKIDNFILLDNNKKILLCNGPSLSGQTQYNENMSKIIKKIAVKYKNITFIATEKFDINLTNVKFTEDIIQLEGCDLNEIGYLSTFCDLIVGRNSGPFCFCGIDKNLKDPNKIFYAFGHNEKDCFYHGANIECEFKFGYSENEIDILNSIENIIIDNLI